MLIFEEVTMEIYFNASLAVMQVGQNREGSSHQEQLEHFAMMKA